MKSMIYKSSFVLAIIAGFFGFKNLNQKSTEPVNNGKEVAIITSVLNVIDQVHYNPKPIDDELSKFVYKSFLERIDNGKRYFTQEDIKKLEVYKLQIDDQINKRTFEFFDLSYDILTKRLAQSEEFYNEIINAPIELYKNKVYELDEEKKPYAKDEAQLKEYWKDFLTYEVITRVERKLSEQEKKADKSEYKTEAQLAEEAVKDIKKTFGDWFARLKKLRRSDRFETYVGAITNYFDPHTDFFNPKEKQDFDINMGGKVEGIGARLLQDGDNIKVSEIITGGPAWKGKELKENDIILSATQEGKEPVELTGMRVDDAVLHIRGKKGTKVTLNVKRQDGTTAKITIVRDEVIIDESFARSVIFDLPGVINNVGYIKLPKFYSSFEKQDGNSCAADVAKEVEKLKANNVNGIILDLRNNSGGSLNDVIEMSGLFIEQGPIVQVKSRHAKPYIYNDNDQRVQYNGPFIIMVNSRSASASEIIAAAMQDYKRAVIVGENTFGKGSVQRFFDLDKAINGNDEYKPLGEVKMTMQKFFRVNGETTQLKGVKPDIILPDNYSYIEYGEKEYDNALTATTIQPLTYNQNVAKIENMESLRKKSEERIKKDDRFIKVEQNAKRLKAKKDNTKSNLSLTEYIKEAKEIEKEAKKFEDLFKNEIPNFSIKNLSQDIDKINSDESKKARNDDWLKEMKKDFYLTETLNIMRDLIKDEKSFASFKEKIKN